LKLSLRHCEGGFASFNRAKASLLFVFDGKSEAQAIGGRAVAARKAAKWLFQA